MGKRILYVNDLPLDTKARELAREFEHYGPIVRCDVPLPKRDSTYAYAFVEYEDSRDALDAYRRLHGKSYRGGSIRIEWAKKGPETRRDRFDRPARTGRSRSRSPLRSNRRNERSPIEKSRSPRVRSSPRKRSQSPRSPAARSMSPVRSPINSPKMSDLDGAI